MQNRSAAPQTKEPNAFPYTPCEIPTQDFTPEKEWDRYVTFLRVRVKDFATLPGFMDL